MDNIINNFSVDNIVKSTGWTIFSTIGIPVITMLWHFFSGKIRNVIIAQKRDTTIINKGKDILRLYFEMVKVILPIGIWYVVINMVNIIFNEKFCERHCMSYICIFLLTVMLVLARAAYVIRRKRTLYLCVCNMLLTLVWIMDVIFAFNISNVMFFLGGITFITVIYLLTIERFLYQKGYYNIYGRSQLAKCILVIRNLGIIFYICCLSFSAQDLENSMSILNAFKVIIIVWSVLSGVEWICLYEKNPEELVECEILLWGNVEKSKKSIIQYKDDKVKYVLNDGTVKVIDNEKIKSMKYMMNHFLKGKALKRGFCLLKSGMGFQFDEYKYLSNSWIGFYTIKNKKKEVQIIHSNRVSEITEPKRFFVLLEFQIIRFIVRINRRRWRKILRVAKRVKNAVLEKSRRYCLWD